MEVKVTYNSEILGNGVFWQGKENEVFKCRNIPAQMIAKKAFQTGEVQKIGMWVAEPVSPTQQSIKE